MSKAPRTQATVTRKLGFKRRCITEISGNCLQLQTSPTPCKSYNLQKGLRTESKACTSSLPPRAAGRTRSPAQCPRTPSPAR